MASFIPAKYTAQSAGAVEYTDCIFAKGLDPSTNECPRYNIKPIWWWGFSNAGALGNAEYPSLPSLPRPLWPGVVGLDRVLSMGQIGLFDI